MRSSVKRGVSFFLVPLTKWYLRKERSYRRGEIHITVKPGIFHPGLFPSTGMILNYLESQDIKRKELLELGCGSALISISAEKAGALATASDISQAALENARVNASRNQSAVSFIHSDLFDAIPTRPFDWIVINPPYYARTPKSEDAFAWYCGENFEYFQKLFGTMKDFTHDRTRIIMTLTKGCDVDRIVDIAQSKGWNFELLLEKHSLLDGKDYLFGITPIHSV